MSRLAPIRDYIESLVHESARRDPLAAARHRAFIAPRLLGGFAALAAFPAYLIVRGVPGALEVLAFAWLVVPILTAYFLSRTGHYEGAHALSALALTALIAVVAAKTGGMASFAAVWLVIVPFEAALSASRRVIILASALALSAAGLLLLLGARGSLPPYAPGGHAALTAFGLVSAALYAAGLALAAESIARTSLLLLGAEEDRCRLLARAMSDGVTRHGQNGAVLSVSAAAERLFGAPCQDLLGHGLFDRVHVADRPAYLHALGDAAVTREPRSAEFRVRCEGCAPGSGAAVKHVWIEMRCQPFDLVGADASAPGSTDVVAVMRDVTDRKAQEQALDAARHEAEAADAAKIRFLATMSHELRTPLNAIIGFSDMLINESTLKVDAARRRDYAQLINASGAHLLSVVNGILDMSKIETGNFEITPEPFTPAPTIAACCELMRLKAHEAGIELAVRMPSDLPDVLADKRALNQILLNLLSNAIKFSNSGGTVTVSAYPEAQWVAVAVEDDGVGIGEADLRRVGDPFFQARTSYDRRHAGTGLGLSIVKGLVALHGGHMDIASRLGHGTKVTVRLPRDGTRTAAAGERSPARDVVRAAPSAYQEMQVKKRA